MKMRVARMVNVNGVNGRSLDEVKIPFHCCNNSTYYYLFYSLVDIGLIFIHSSCASSHHTSVT